MKLTRKCEYACLALIELAREYNNGKIRLEDICTKQDIPKKFMEQIFIILKRGGYVKSKKGPEGGYSLSRAPEKIFLADVIRLMDGALAPVESVSKYFYEETPLEKNKKLIKVMRDIRNYISNKLEKTSLADLLP